MWIVWQADEMSYLFFLKKQNKKLLKVLYAAVVTDALRVNPCPAEPGYTLPLQTV